LTGFANILAEAVDTLRRNNAVHAALDQMKNMVADRDRLVKAQSKLLSEKGDLAQELQHRVRNNLQLVYGMLNKEIETAPKNTETAGIKAIARRVMTLAKVYDHLLGSGLTRTTDFGGYLTSLCDSFRDLESPLHQGIVLSCSSQSLMIDLETATSLGLVIAELLSNSYLHAFPENKGVIKISLSQREKDREARIEVVDDGVGFVDSGESKRRGLGLVKRLMQQVHGSAEVHSDRGTAWILKFPLLPLAVESLLADAE
jgi:two-component sensor histidine kinase